MLTYLKFSNYKCLSDKEFNLNKMNIFTGYNGRGKSSVMQAILMLAQSCKKADINSLASLHLNGNQIQLGDFDELLANTDRFNFDISMKVQQNEEEHTVLLTYEMDDDFKVGKLSGCYIDSEDYMEASGRLNKQGESDKKTLSRPLPNFLHQRFDGHKMHYVSAERMGPVKFVEKKEIPEFFVVGSNGSRTINTLSDYKEKVSPLMNVEYGDDVQHTLSESVSSWINFIMHGGYVSVKGEDKDNSKNRDFNKKSAILELGFAFDESGRIYSPNNVGFGYSYILSIIVTALIAKDDSIVIVENPEAHLHPEAQTRLTFLLAKLAARGVQVFIETHSEHVINGVRLAALKPEYHLSNSDVRIFFFDKDFSKADLKIEKNGRIPNWPIRFFDQYQEELAEILKLGANIK